MKHESAYRAYPTYKDSRIAWLGKVPSEWLITRTKYVVPFTTGWTPPTGNDASYVGTNLWANISDLGTKTLCDTAKRISDEAVTASRVKVSPTGSLLFSFKLSIGQVSFAGREMFTNEAIATFLRSSTLSLDYAYYAFPLLLIQNADENIYGAKLLNQQLIRSAQFALPSLFEQQAIAAFLDRETAKIDELITKQNRLIALLDEKRQAVISHAVTKGLDPNVPVKDSGIEWLGNVPAHWSILPLKRSFRIVGGSTPKSDDPSFWDGDIQWFTPADLGKSNDLYIRESHRTISQAGLESCSTSIVGCGALVISTRAPIGYIAIAATDLCFNQGCKALVSYQKELCVEFFYYLLLSAADTLNVYGKGTTFLELSGDVLGAFLVPMPTNSEQEAIASFLINETSKIDALVEKAKESIELMKERRSALISAAVTGKIDVRELV